MIVIKIFYDYLLATREKLLDVYENVKNDSDRAIIIKLNNIGEIFRWLNVLKVLRRRLKI